ncbi:MAG: 50S ribosomal protein L23 [Betaproteobacteria bacterium]|nr:50S ribosomal protein L23 [Betaproteobacteria bacterium]
MKSVAATEKYFGVLQGPVVTEKSNFLAEGEFKSGRSVMFKVAPWATKKDVCRAVIKIFEVDVIDVRILNRRGKKGRAVSRGKHAYHCGSRRAYVRLGEGQDINFVSHFGGN